MKKLQLLTIACTMSFFGAKAQTEYLSNGDFENGFTGWNNLSGDGGVAAYSLETTDVHQGSNAMRVNVTTLGSNPWSIQSIHTPLTVESGSTYEITLWAKAEGGNNQLVLVQQNSAYNSKTINITGSWEKYTWTWEAQEASPEFKIQFPATGIFLIDDISIVGQSLGPVELTMDISTKYQEMEGFGGALTWYCDQVTKSSYKDEITQLMFDDLGLDLLRFKNWYYPINYPTNKTVVSTSDFETDWFKYHFDATQELYDLAKGYNPNIQVLLSSWGPPSTLKNNNALEEGKLKKENDAFVYDQYATYWTDVLDNIGFTPDWISIQNEPGYTNAGWTTCEWRPEETAEFAGYSEAWDAVYNAIKDRPNIPKMMGPEAENIGAAGWDSGLNSFREFASPIQNKPGLGGYIYHLYNFYQSQLIEDNVGLLHMIRDEFGNKPNIMTEYSTESMDWVTTCHYIQNCITEANASGYIYWELVWNQDKEASMIKVFDNGTYEVTPYFHAMKHFAKFIDKGYTRIGLSGGDASLKVSAFTDPSEEFVTLILINTSSSTRSVALNTNEWPLLAYEAYQSTDGSYWNTITLNIAEGFELPAKSATTVVLEKDMITAVSATNKEEKTFKVYPNPSKDLLHIEGLNGENWHIVNILGETVDRGSGSTANVSALTKGIYFLIGGNRSTSFIKE